MFDATAILRGLAAGVAYSLTAFAKKQGQPFDWQKFLTSTIIGTGAGVVMALVDMPVEAAHEFLIGLGAVPIVENIIKATWRKLLNYKETQE